METERLKARSQVLLAAFIIALLASGLTAFPLEWELRLLDRLAGPKSPVAEVWPSLSDWVHRVHSGLQQTYSRFPFIAYGTDWLAFAHIVIAIAFVGPLQDPVQNLWVVEFGLIACVLVLPLALICGPIRGIPLFWRLIDCSFGLLGALPLWLARSAIREMRDLQAQTNRGMV